MKDVIKKELLKLEVLSFVSRLLNLGEGVRGVDFILYCNYICDLLT